MARPYLRCCVPRQRPYPSGWHWTHSDFCTRGAGQKVREADPRVIDWNRSPAIGPMPEGAAYVDAHVDDGDDDADE